MATQNCINKVSYPLNCSSAIIDPGASGDSYIDYYINAVQKYRVGTDDSDSGAYVIAPSALGTGNLFRMSTAGERNLPLTPAFLGIKTDVASNVTGDGSTYTLTFNSSEPFDQAGNFNGTTTFTSPITGRYMLSVRYRAADMASGNGQTFSLITSNRTYVTGKQTGGNRAIAGGSFLTFATVPLLVDMDAADTFTATIVWSGSSKVVDVSSTGTGNEVTICGYLVC